MNQDGKTLRSPYVARGQCIVTGESFPEVSESRLARCFLLTMQNSNLDLSKLSVIQSNREQLAFSMKSYIGWLIPNMDKVKQNAKNIHEQLSKQVDNQKVHGRLNETIIALYIGFANFLDFMSENKVISTEKAEALLEEAYTTFNDIAIQQMIDVESSNPVSMFLNALEQLYITEKIYIKDHQKKDNNIYVGTHVGYINQERKEYWFFPDVIYKEVVRFYSGQGIKFPISKASLWKYLDDAEILFKSGKNDRRTTRRVVPANNNNSIAFIVIPQDKINDNVKFELPKNQRGYYVQF